MNHFRQTLFVLCMALSLAVLLFLLPAAAEEAVFEIDGTTLVRYNGSDEEVVVPEGIETLGEFAFDSRPVKKVTLPETLTHIESYCFFSCKGLEEITLPASVTEVGETQVFAWCESLQAIHVAEGNEQYVSVDGVLFTKDCRTLMHYPEGKSADTYEIPQGTETVLHTAFGSAKIRRIVIPASVQKMSETVLSYVAGLQQIEVEEGSPLFISRDGILCSGDGKTILCYPDGRPQENLTPGDFPDGIECIGEAAFVSCAARTVTLPDTVRQVRRRAFSESKALQTVVLPVSVEEIGDWAFDLCPELRTVLIMNGNASIIKRNNGMIIVENSPEALIAAPAGGSVEAYCSENQVPFLAVNLSGGESPEQIAAILEGIEQDRFAAEEEERQRVAAEREAQAQEELKALAAEQAKEDQKWAASWPPKGKTQGLATINSRPFDLNKNFYINFAENTGHLHSFAPACLEEKNDSRTEEPVTQYHITFLSGDEHLRGFYYPGTYSSGIPSINLRWDYITGPGAADFRIDIVSEHYWSSETAHVEILDEASLTAELVSGDVYIPVGKAVNISDLYTRQAFVSLEPETEYSCGIVPPEGSPEETDTYQMEGWYEFTASQPGDYPVVLRVWVEEEYEKDFPIMIHASEDVTEAAVAGEAPKSLMAIRQEKEDQERREKEALRQAQDMAARAGAEIQTVSTEEGTFFYHLQEGSAVIDKLLPTGDTMTVPDNLKGHKVTQIGSNVLDSMSGLKSLHLPDSLLRIGNSAFYSCGSLEEITLPSGLTAESIGWHAFAGCGLEDLVLADGTSLMSVSLEAFRRGGKYDDGMLMSACRDEMEYLVSEDGSAVIIGYLPDSWGSLVTIPSSLNGHPVREIAENAFSGYNLLETVILPEGLEKIGDEAFARCSGLKEVQFPSTLQEIGSRAFFGIDADSLDLPESVTASLAPDWYTGKLKQDTTGTWSYRIMADQTAVICGYACTAKVVFPSEVDGIPVTVIAQAEQENGDRNQIREVVIRPPVRKISESAFQSMQSLKKVTLPETLTEIGDHAFQYIALTEISIPEGVTDIGSYGFASCNSLKKVTFPSTLQTIGEHAFTGSGLTTLTLPEGIVQIGNGAFANSLYAKTRITRVVFSGADTRLGKGIFGYDDGSRQFYDEHYEEAVNGTITYDYDNPDNWTDYYGDSSSYDVPELTITCWPGSTADRLYTYNVKKTYFKWGADNIRTAPADRVLRPGVITPEDTIYELIIPEGVEEIAENAFADTRLCKVTLPSTLKKIGSGAFRGCAAIDTLVLPKNLEEIGAHALEGTKLKSIVLPAVLTRLGEQAFCGTPITSLTLPAGLEEIPDGLCAHCYELKNVKIQGSITRIGNEAFLYCYSLSSVNLPEGLVSIGQSAFAQYPEMIAGAYTQTGGKTKATKLTALKIPASLVSIGEDAFRCCDALTSVSFAKGSMLTEIGDRAFAMCLSLKEITLPDTVQALGEDAFSFSLALKKANLGKGLVTAGDRALSYCPVLSALTVPDTLTEIGGDLLTGTGNKLTVTCTEGSAIEVYLTQYYPDLKITRSKK